MQKILIINCGGTFNKRYNPLKGELEVPNDADALNKILKYFYNLDYDIVNIIHKDSLDMNDNDRKKILDVIENSDREKFLIIHGTDTMDKTAEFLTNKVFNKIVLLTGSMVPCSIDSVEANANLSMSIGYLLNNCIEGIFISMHGIIDIHNKIYKNREVGIFQLK